MKKNHKQSALTSRLKKAQPVKISTVITDARVLELRGPRPGVVVVVPLDLLLPEWYAFHKVEPAPGGYDVNRTLLKVKRVAQ